MSAYLISEIEKIPEGSALNVTTREQIQVVGKFVDWTSSLDNDPDGESITLEIDGHFVEIFIDEISSIESVPADSAHAWRKTT